MLINRYPTLLECFEAFIGRKVVPDEEKLNYWVGHDGKKPFKIRFDKWLNTTRKCWGWAEYSKKALHVWIADECDEAEIAAMLAHEIGHFQKADEEKKASMYETVTRTAMKLAKELIGEGGRHD